MKYLFFFARTDIFCINLVWFMLILIAGTITQKYFGIQSVNDIFFDSNIIWIYNIIPAPGGSLTLLLIFLGLLAKLIDEKYIITKSGTFFIHIGIMLFLIGAFLTSKISQEGVMTIDEKSTSNFFIDKGGYDLIISTQNKTHLKSVIKNHKIRKPHSFYIKELDLFIEIKKFYRNCNLKFKRDTIFEVKNIESFPENNYDRPCVLVEIKNKNFSKTIYLVEDLNIKLNYLNEIKFSLKKTHITIPFSITLLNFQKIVYPNTSMAKAYKSTILIKSNNQSWKFNIEMNKPFRYAGYTFYQTSFIENKMIKTTVLTIVKNSANFLFYLASITVFTGLTIHLIKIFIKKKV